MESTGSILDRTVASIQESKNRSMDKSVCVVCGSESETNYGYIHKRRNTICSKECYERYEAYLDKEFYKEYIYYMPIKYRTINADKKLVTDNYGVNLFITGKSGSGKTVLSAGLAKECIRNRVEYKWISYPQFIMELQNMYRSKDESPFDRADEVANFRGVLIIDDLGAEKMTDWVRQITYYIINEREQRQLPIIITSNFSLEQIAEQVDVRISSRIAGMCKSIKLTANDRRLSDTDKSWKTGEAKRGKIMRGDL